MLTFLNDSNLGLDPERDPWNEVLPALGIETISTIDLPELDRSVAEHEPDIVFMPIADFHRVLASGDRHYRVLPWSSRSSREARTCRVFWSSAKTIRLRASRNSRGRLRLHKQGVHVQLLRAGDPAAPPRYVARRFLRPSPDRTWQGQIDAVISGEVRATMVPEDVWRSTASNGERTKIVGRYDEATGAIIVVRNGLDAGVLHLLLDAAVAWKPERDAIFGGFKPFTDAAVATFFRDLDLLPGI